MFPLLLFLAIPAAEIFLFIEVGGEIGAWPTVGMIFATALVGGTILRYQGRQMIARAREQVARQELPVNEFAHGAVLVLAAILLLTPGFITDALGALLLIPFLRRLILSVILLASRSRIRGFEHAADPKGPHRGGKVIDGEFVDISEAGRPDGPAPPERRLDRD
jgi:UPF0716 protein FxsA